MIVFSWHGYRAGLAGNDAIVSQMSAGVTHIGVPMHHTDDYVQDLVAAGFGIIRTMEPPWNAGREGIAKGNLGKVLLDYQSPTDPGELFVEYAKNLQEPIDGIGWNLEHRVHSIEVSKEDRKYWDKYAKGMNVIALRCQQFSQLVRLYQKVAETKFNKKLVTVAYSGYMGIGYNRPPLSVQEAYGCDWHMLAHPFTYRGLVYPPLDYAMCAWHGLSLPTISRPPSVGLKILHNLGLPAYEPSEQRFADYEKMLRDRLKKLQPDDGIGVVACSPLTGPWNWEEERLCEVMASVLNNKEEPSDE